MPTLTTNFSFNKPLVNDPIDEDIWGGQLNANWDSIDGILAVPAASKFGAVVVQSTDDASFEIITGQGTAGQVLASNGADALPSFQTLGAWNLLTTQTASASSTIDFTSNIDSTHKKYAITLDNVVTSVSTIPQFRTSTDGGSTFDSGSTDYMFAFTGRRGDGTASNGDSTGSSFINLAASNGVAATYSGTVYLSDPAATAKTLINTTLASNGDNLITWNGAGVRDSAADVDAIRFLVSSGNFTSGIFKLYGIV